MEFELTDAQLTAVRPYLIRLKNNRFSEESTSGDGILTMESSEAFPGAAAIQVCRFGNKFIVDAVTSGGQVTTYEVLIPVSEITS